MFKKYLTIFLLIVSLTLSGCTTGSVAIVPEPLSTQDRVNVLNEEGKVFSLQKYYSTVGSGENKTIHLRTGSEQVILLEYSFVGSDTPQDLFLYENPTLTSNGTEVQIDSRNRNLNTNSSTMAYTEPNITNYGHLLDRDLLVPGKVQAGVDSYLPYHWILQSNTSYLIVTLNRGGIDEQIVNVIWYEE